jgi:diketogulonate reductase-like aldo/keto reductase
LKGGVLSEPVVVEIAQAHNRTPAQVGLYWLIQQPKVITIPMSQDLKHLRDNMAALSLDLSKDEIRRLDAVQG